MRGLRIQKILSDVEMKTNQVKYKLVNLNLLSQHSLKLRLKISNSQLYIYIKNSQEIS